MSSPSPLSIAAASTFERHFGRAPQRLVQAPGRVNLIGEHTDYNDGFVLPCAIDRGTVIAASPREDKRVRVVAADMGDVLDEFELDVPIVPTDTQPWANYVRGSLKHLLAMHAPGLRGAEIAIAGNLPRGAGLSSSASLEVAVLQAFKSLYGLHALDPTTMARIAQAAENQFVGCACGIMDQLISARGMAGCALLIDCRSLETTPVPLPEGLAIMVIDSRVRRGLVDSAYNERRAQCQSAAKALGVRALRDADLALLASHRDAVDALAYRRARHIITENDRTVKAALALAAGDTATVATLMSQSHASMRHDFEITVPSIDALARIVQKPLGREGGCRMTGGGFGGCVVALVPHALVDAVSAAVHERYRAPNAEAAQVHVYRASGGAAEIR